MSYKNNVEFIEALASVGNLLNSLDKAVHKLSKYLVEYFPEREHYDSDEAREFIVLNLRPCLDADELAILVAWDEFKNKRNQTDKQKSIAHQGHNIQGKLIRWYAKIGNLHYGAPLIRTPEKTGINN